MEKQIKEYFDNLTMSDECINHIERLIAEKSAGKRRTGFMFKPSFACAIAAFLIIISEATVFASTGSGIISHIISFAKNAVITESVDENGWSTSQVEFDTEHAAAPAEVIDDRLIFTANGEHKDITEQVSDEQAYVYTYTDEEEMTHYLIVGGNPAEFGYAEFMKDAAGCWVGGYFSGGKVGGDINPEWLQNAKETWNIPW